MITSILAILAAGGVFSASHYGADISTGWSVTLGIVTFIAIQIGVSLFLRKKIMAAMEAVQLIMVNGQKQLQQKVQRWQMRPPSSLQAAQREIFEDTKVFVREALAETNRLDAFRLWVPMIA